MHNDTLYEIEIDYTETCCGDFWEWQVVKVVPDKGVKEIVCYGVCESESQAIGEAEEALREAEKWQKE